MRHEGKKSVVQLICKQDGSVATVLSDGVGLFSGEKPPSTLDELMPTSSRKRYLSYLEDVKADGYGLCESVTLQSGNREMHFSLFGVYKNDAFHLLALRAPQHLYQAFEDFMRMLNEQGVLLREAQKKAFSPVHPEAEKQRILEEYMAINNELAKKERELALKHKQLQSAYAAIEELSATDPLTGIANRRKTFDFLSQEIIRSNRYGIPLSVMSLDIDHFKRINDTFGHTAGDKALVAFARTCQEQLRATDIIGRIGGEEFITILPHTQEGPAMTTAERIRAATADLDMEHEGSTIRFTVSIGVVTFIPGEAMDEILCRVDEALYQAKNAGRNCVRFTSGVGGSTRGRCHDA